jgi:hypothetical protein
MNSNEKVWFALVGVRPLEGNELITDAKGAYVNVACLSEDESRFKKKLYENFEYYKFQIFDIDDIETEETLDIENDSVRSELLNEIKEGYGFSWGTFHSFDEE